MVVAVTDIRVVVVDWRFMSALHMQSKICWRRPTGFWDQVAQLLWLTIQYVSWTLFPVCRFINCRSLLHLCNQIMFTYAVTNARYDSCFVYCNPHALIHFCVIFWTLQPKSKIIQVCFCSNHPVSMCIWLFNCCTCCLLSELHCLFCLLQSWQQGYPQSLFMDQMLGCCFALNKRSIILLVVKFTSTKDNLYSVSNIWLHYVHWRQFASAYIRLYAYSAHHISNISCERNVSTVLLSAEFATCSVYLDEINWTS